MKTLVLDAGHGGHDPGASYDGVHEKDINLKIVLAMKELLNGTFNVVLTRSTDVYITRSNRARVANGLGASLLFSVHCNANDNRDACGFEVFTSPGQTHSDDIATIIFETFTETFPKIKPRTEYVDGDPDKEAEYTVLVKTVGPAVLVETEFISNKTGLKFMQDNLEKIAECYAEGIKKALL